MENNAIDNGFEEITLCSAGGNDLFVDVLQDGTIVDLYMYACDYPKDTDIPEYAAKIGQNPCFTHFIDPHKAMLTIFESGEFHLLEDEPSEWVVNFAIKYGFDL